jgi:transcriptional regulator with XRE-family HTH domain
MRCTRAPPTGSRGMETVVVYTVGSMRQPTPEQQRIRLDSGDLLRRAREERRMSQDALAERLHVSRRTVSSYEAGTTSPLVDQLQAIELAVGLTPQAMAYPPPRSQVVATPLDAFMREAPEVVADAQVRAEAVERSRHAPPADEASEVPPAPRDSAGSGR